jgi:hypothetical protein
MLLAAPLLTPKYFTVDVAEIVMPPTGVVALVDDMSGVEASVV